MKNLTHDQARQMRRDAADMVEAGSTPSEVAAKCGTSLSWVYGACALNGVRPKASVGARSASRALRILRLLLDGKTKSQVADELDVSVARVSNVIREAREAGWEV